MDDDFIVTAYVVIDKTMRGAGASGRRAGAGERRGGADGGGGRGEVLPEPPGAGAGDAAPRALPVRAAERVALQPPAARAGRLAGASRWRRWARCSRPGEAFLIDSMPVPVCRRARARRCAQGARARTSAATARRSGSSSSAGGCTWSAPPTACRWPSTCCRAGCTT